MNVCDMAAEFHDAYGVEPVDVRERATAVSITTQRCAALVENTKGVSTALWRLIADLEAGASDEVVLAGFEDSGVALAQMVLELYGVANLLGLTRFAEIIERAHEARMSAVSGRRYKPVRVAGLVELPVG